jgi:hypothetical protein
VGCSGGIPRFPADGARVILEHGGDCLPGTCPFYSIEIRSDGTVIYDGGSIGPGPVLGRHTSRISVEAAHALLERFVRAHFFDMNDVYETATADVPVDVLTLEMAGRKKRVVDRPECHHLDPKEAIARDLARGADPPKELCELERAVDWAAHIEQWGLTRDDGGVRFLRR